MAVAFVFLQAINDPNASLLDDNESPLETIVASLAAAVNSTTFGGGGNLAATNASMISISL